MPDTTSLPMAEGGRSGGGKTNWPVIIGVGGAGVLLLVLLMGNKKSGASGTTAAGTSINAALGTVQEQQLNIMGEIGKSEQDLTGQLAALNSNVVIGNQAVQSQAGNAANLNYYLQAFYYGQTMYQTTGNAAWLDWAKQFLGQTSNNAFANVQSPVGANYKVLSPNAVNAGLLV